MKDYISVANYRMEDIIIISITHYQETPYCFKNQKQ